MAKQLLLEGGLGGHISHVYENTDLTFDEVKDIFIKASKGDLIGAEKVDGQNLYISYSVKDKEPRAARNKGDIKKGGLTPKDLADKFKDREALYMAFTESFARWQEAIASLDPMTQAEIFGPDANVYFSAEVQSPKTKNVIDYGVKRLIIHDHGHAEYDRETGEVTRAEVGKEHRLLINLIDDVFAKEQGKEVQIVNNAIKNIRELDDKVQLNLALMRLGKFLRRNNLNWTNTIGDFVVRKLYEYFETNLPELDGKQKAQLAKKMMGEKGINIRDIKKGISPEAGQRVNLLARKPTPILREIFSPLELIIHDFAVAMLKGLESAFILDNKKALDLLRTEVTDAIKKIQGANIDQATEILNQQLRKLKDVENISTAAEGFVFAYNGQMYKFTGNFAPINQILGLFKFGRGSMPPLQSVIKEAETDKVFGILPGGYKPPHIAHFLGAKQFAEIPTVDEVFVFISPKSRWSYNKEVEISADKSLGIWNIFAQRYPKIHPIKVGQASPVAAVFDFLEKVPPGTKVILGVGYKDVEENRYRSVQAFIDRKNLNIQFEVIPVNAEMPDWIKNLSASDLRDIIANDEKELFMKYMPTHLDDGEKEQIWNMAKGNQKAPMEETSGMAAGAVEGAPNPKIIDKGREPLKTYAQLKEYFIDRHKLYEEFTLRENIRRQLITSMDREILSKKQAGITEAKLRSFIRQRILTEADTEKSPHPSTGINVLEDLLKKIIPQLETDYKTLTTNDDQRKSFRAHILRAVDQTVRQADINKEAGADIAELKENLASLLQEMILDDDIDVAVGEDDEIPEDPSAAPEDEEKFIDIDKDGIPDDEEDTFGIEGEDETGRNMAQTAFEKMEKNILDSYAVLSDDEDKRLFYDYLLANLKLYFDKFESELQDTLEEPQVGSDIESEFESDLEPGPEV